MKELVLKSVKELVLKKVTREPGEGDCEQFWSGSFAQEEVAPACGADQLANIIRRSLFVVVLVCLFV